MEDDSGILMALLTVIVLVLVAAGMWGCPQYSIYSQRATGEAELARAEYSKKVAVQEAQAKMDSSKMLAQAEIERAKGVAEANKIIGNSLKGNEDYLRYLWIDGIHGKEHQIIYIPTEAGLPILEAGRRP